jgi:predicted RNA-binding protein
MLKGSERTLVMKEAARVIVDGQNIICIDTFGARETVSGARIHEANLVKHEIMLKALQG